MTALLTVNLAASTAFADCGVAYFGPFTVKAGGKNETR